LLAEGLQAPLVQGCHDFEDFEADIREGPKLVRVKGLADRRDSIDDGGLEAAQLLLQRLVLVLEFDDPPLKKADMVE